MSRDSFFHQVYELVRSVPPGKVVTYGQVARWLGKANGARAVGWAMRALPKGSDVPWQRVVNSRGELSLTSQGKDLQRALLESEGIQFDDRGRIDLHESGWDGELPS